ncbi:MAG: SAM-dependent DNA methyltransferase [Spirochaetia bacterium]|nr:SAM-dependent DNA methyltransferase [Spirochaetia bacterium]
MAVKKSQLYSSLWASCDKLRGGMDASQYKDYILTLLFIKYVSDKYKDDPYGAIAIPKGASFEDLVALKGDKNIGEKIDILIAKLAEANNLTGIIDNAHFNDEAKIGKGDEMVDKLTDLIAIFQKPDLNFKNNRAADDDLIGDAYEYLMKNFATASGKSKGQFYTPAEVSRILATVINISKCKNRKATIYDPACGSGSLLIRAANEAPFPLAIYGQEKDISTAGLAKMNLVLHNKASGEIFADSTFSNPGYKDDNDDTKLRKFDYIVANPPFSMKNWMDGLKEYGRFDDYDEMPPEKNGDYAWLLHIIKSMKNNTGKAAVILPHGVLFRGNAEESIRKNIIDRHLIKGIIGLPANLFYGTGIPACIIVLDKENTANRSGIFMIDASHGFIKDGDKNRLREQDIYKIVTIFNSMTEVSGFSRFVPFAEIIEKNAYNLNIPRYIDSSEKEDLQSIEAHLYGGIPQEDIDNIPHFWNLFPNLKKQMFGEYSKGFYKLLINKDDIHKTICENAEFLKYNKKVNEEFEEWKKFANPILTNLKSTDSNKQVILKLSEEIISKFAKFELLDKYDVYQVLLAYWNEIMNDDVLLIIYDELGYALAKDTYEIKEEPKETKKKKKSSKKEEKPKEPKVIGWEGRLIPKQVVLDTFFINEQKEIQDEETILRQTESELEEFVETNSDDEGYLRDYIKADGKMEQKKITSRISILKKEKKTNKEEYIILSKYSEYDKAVKAQDKKITGLKKSLDENCRKRYDTFTDEEIKNLLVNRKWYKAIQDGIQNLYITVANHLTKRIAELCERYENTLPELTLQLEKQEEIVFEHLNTMGFRI